MRRGSFLLHLKGVTGLYAGIRRRRRCWPDIFGDGFLLLRSFYQVKTPALCFGRGRGCCRPLGLRSITSPCGCAPDRPMEAAATLLVRACLRQLRLRLAGSQFRFYPLQPCRGCPFRPSSSSTTIAAVACHGDGVAGRVGLRASDVQCGNSPLVVRRPADSRGFQYSARVPRQPRAVVGR